MSLPKRICRSCGKSFILTPNKPGNINDCIHCAKENHTKIMALVSYPSTASADIQIQLTQDHHIANKFNNAQRHHWSSAF